MEEEAGLCCSYGKASAKPAGSTEPGWLLKVVPVGVFVFL